MIKATNVHRSYYLAKKEVSVLRGIDLEIKAGEKIFLCGPSGAGKTTLMYTLAGLERPNDGEVFLDDTSFYKLSSSAQANLRNDKIGYIFQSYFLLPELTAIENVLVPGMIGGKSDREKAKAALTRVGLAERIDHLPAELSGGEQQRVAIARALVNDPSIIFADEPTGNLDSRNGDEIMKILLEVVAERNATLVVVTHDTALSRHGDRVLTIKDGKIAD
ncbi:ABC transporter ATP-binding protein [Akkermansiaceae bacterium]|nr:ABC transporter ATP-binding protein [Akkermansiaceae bacterium]MDB4271117.1 ABC transporter ATP-binding protein [bacterium]MDA7877504.1 ABC transporter ATP-binding protein [Akkermansiaceae bacterium]MDB0067919.1 ABC transporter ATP-binding protein [Akkermansiaceae bacterium]MDB4333920.1 ABC transporter ATP-binding protein [Akkermansiaceae bacterium]